MIFHAHTHPFLHISRPSLTTHPLSTGTRPHPIPAEMSYTSPSLIQLIIMNDRTIASSSCNNSTDFNWMNWLNWVSWQVNSKNATRYHDIPNFLISVFAGNGEGQTAVMSASSLLPIRPPCRRIVYRLRAPANLQPSILIKARRNSSLKIV